MFGFEGLSVKIKKGKKIKTHMFHMTQTYLREIQIYLNFSFRAIVINKYISTIVKDRGVTNTKM